MVSIPKERKETWQAYWKAEVRWKRGRGCREYLSLVDGATTATGAIAGQESGGDFGILDAPAVAWRFLPASTTPGPALDGRFSTTYRDNLVFEPKTRKGAYPDHLLLPQM